MATGKHKRTKIVRVLHLLDRTIQTMAGTNLIQAFKKLVPTSMAKDAWLAHQPQTVTKCHLLSKASSEHLFEMTSFPLECRALLAQLSFPS